jgi:hypothetical protein
MSDAVLYFKRAPSAAVPLTVGSTPFAYVNTGNSAQVVTVTGGAVTLIEVDVGVGLLPIVGLFGNYLLLPEQSVRVSYLITKPTMTVVTL